MKKYFIFFFIINISLCFSQKILIKGNILDSNEFPIENVEVSIQNKTTKSNKKGFFSLELDTKKSEDSILISHEKYEKITSLIDFKNSNNLNFILKPSQEIVLKEVVFQKQNNTDLNSIQIKGNDLKNPVSISGGIEDVLKTLPYVNSNTELSSQYMVRGGNFDENLLYINSVEIHKPFLVRSGQQEGLSAINPNMVSLINFSAGGFEAKYGDKMSSVLDITYRKPKKFELGAEASLIGGALTVGLADKKQKFTALVGTRYRNTNLLLNTFDTDTDFNPVFFDVQSYLTYKFNPKLNISFLSNISNNTFNMIPRTRETNFGSLNRPIQLKVFYQGKEKDSFIAQNLSFNINYKPINKLNLSSNFYIYNGLERENFTITSNYLIQEVDPISNQVTSSINAGTQRNHARNMINFLILGTEFRAKYIFNNNTSLESGVQIQQENIKDLSNEWQLTSNAGFSQPLPPDFDSDLNLKYHIASNLNLSSTRYNSFVQFNKKLFWNTNKIMINAGIRSNYWDFNKQNLISPRLQFAIKPYWKKDFLFRFATGIYYQAPIYKEAKLLSGEINKDIKAQKSYHFIFGTDYEFKLLERPFKLSNEVYYKHISDLIPYYVDNVRINYTGINNAIGRSFGIDSRLNGEFIKNAESWISVSYARSQQNIENQGWIAKPTDQRLRMSLFFQDYMKFIPSMKVNAQIVYAFGLPNGSPLFTNPYDYQSYLEHYKRVDLGFTKVFVDQNINKSKSKFLNKFKELSASVEIFNLFNIRNTISNLWVQDVTNNNYYSVPNRLTGRFFNFKITTKF